MNDLSTEGGDRVSARPIAELHAWSIPVTVYDPGLQRILHCEARTEHNGQLRAEPLLFVPGEARPVHWDWFTFIDTYPALLARAFAAGYAAGRRER